MRRITVWATVWAFGATLAAATTLAACKKKVEEPTETAEITEAAAGTVYTCPMHPDVTSDQPGKCPTCGMDLVAQEKGEAGESGASKCPMHSGAAAGTAEKCAKCGMDLTPGEKGGATGEKAGH